MEEILKRGGGHLRRITLDGGIDEKRLLYVALENCGYAVEEICVEVFDYHASWSVANLLRDISRCNPAALRNLSFTTGNVKLTFAFHDKKVDDLVPLSSRIIDLEISFAKAWCSDITAKQMGRLRPIVILAKFMGLAIRGICSLEQLKLTFENVKDNLNPGEVLLKELHHMVVGYEHLTIMNLSCEERDGCDKECLKIIVNRNIDKDMDENFEWFLREIMQEDLVLSSTCFIS